MPASIYGAAAPPTLSLPPAGLLTSSQARWAYGCTVAAAKQTPRFPCLEDRCRHQGLENNTTFDIDASNGSVAHKETDQRLTRITSSGPAHTDRAHSRSLSPFTA